MFSATFFGYMVNIPNHTAGVAYIINHPVPTSLSPVRTPPIVAFGPRQNRESLALPQDRASAPYRLQYGVLFVAQVIDDKLREEARLRKLPLLGHR